MAVGYNQSQLDAFARVLRNLVSGGVDIAADLLDLQDQMDQIVAGASGPDAFAQNLPHSGLNFKYLDGRIDVFGGAPVATAAGQIAVDASATRFLEVDSAGTVYQTAGAFTAGRKALYQVQTNGSTFTSILDKRAPFALLTAGAVGASSLASAAVTGVKLASACEALAFGRQSLAGTESGQLYTSHGTIGYVMDGAGYLIGHSDYLSAARTAGTVTFQPTINGATLGQAGLDNLVDAGTPQKPRSTVAYAANAAYLFAAGDVIGINFATNTFTPAGSVNVAALLRVRRT